MSLTAWPTNCSSFVWSICVTWLSLFVLSGTPR